MGETHGESKELKAMVASTYVSEEFPSGGVSEKPTPAFTAKDLRAALRLYAVTDSTWLCGRSLAQCVADALEGGVTCVQLREKDLAYEELKALGLEVRAVCKAAHIPFIVNDHVELAREIDADGVHVGQEDMACVRARAILGPDKIVGVSVQTVEEALQAERDRADYLGVGAIFPTPTKPESPHMGIEALRTVCAHATIPVVAIGGLDEMSILKLAGCGVDGVAVVSAVFAQDDIVNATQKLVRCVEQSLQ
ncbi:MAG: thiamine phosphate synthase [Eggerthellaceae bacterium]|jgi:thiamine-phosphate pyrophosphorylase|nr:thiamine phosphate synthase [Eggerthellaceae bacterium]MDR2721999.1 thiamine phosphate synthase [Coriobacteriaceae bacterium]